MGHSNGTTRAHRRAASNAAAANSPAERRHSVGPRGRIGRREKIAGAVYRAMMATNQLPQSLPFASRFDRFREEDRMQLDIDGECGYPDPTELNAMYYREQWETDGLARRCVNIWPDESWAVPPEVYQNDRPGEEPFDLALDKLNKKFLLFPELHRLDILSGVGSYGIMLIGTDDGGVLERPPAWINPDTGEPRAGHQPAYNLTYLQSFDESCLRINQEVSDPNKPRFRQPEFYTINFNRADTTGNQTAALVGVTPDPAIRDNRIHWTRVIHVADNLATSRVFGVPRQKPVVPYLYNVRKVAGGAGQMFWQGGFPGYSFEQFQDTLGTGIEEIDEEDLREDIQAYILGLQRYLTTVGGSWKSLAVQVASPDHHLSWYLKLISVALGVPMRKFLGAEEGKLASGQDSDDWRTRLRARQENHVEPRILRPTIDRFMSFGVLPRVPSYNVAWRDLRALSDKDRAMVSLQRVQALTQFTTGNVRSVFPVRLLLTLIMGFTEKEADVIQEQLKKELKENPLPPVVAPTVGGKGAGGTNGGGRRGNAFQNPTGRPPIPGPSVNKRRSKKS